MKARSKKLGKNGFYSGSALILAVVLTSLLAIVGALFVLSTRVDRVATSAISDNRDLNLAVDTLVAKISEQLVLDVPGVAGPNEEYYDYPDVTDRWLASSEPYDADSGAGYDCYWPQISDVTGYLLRPPRNYAVRDVPLTTAGSPGGPFYAIIDDYKPILLDVAGGLMDQLADADGDGIADAKWILLDGITSSRGVPIYAAVRVIDNCAMLNVNTVYRNTGDEHERQGDMLTDINIDELKKLGSDDLDVLIRNRDGSSAPVGRQVYYLEAARRIDNPDVNSHMYALYDISDELSLRNRFVLYPQFTIPRLEADGCLSTTLRAPLYRNNYRPYSQWEDLLDAWDSWQRRFDPLEDSEVPVANGYDFRHLLTTYNMDRIITPLGAKMININQTDDPNYAADLYNLISVLLANEPQAQVKALQMAANIKDHIDQDSVVTEYMGYFGFERPCVYISEVAHNMFMDLADPNRPTYRSYAVELHKPYAGDQRPIDGDWRLLIDDEEPGWPILWSGTSNFHVMLWQDDRARLDYDFADANGFTPPDEATEVSPTTTLRWAAVAGAVSYDVYLGTSDSAVDDSATPVSAGLTAIEYNPAGLDANTLYYWRVDDFNGVATRNGKVLTFTTGGSAVPPPEAQTFGGWAPGTPVFVADSLIKLQRKVQVGGTDTFITVDSTPVPAWVLSDLDVASFQRDITRHKCVRRLWDDSAGESDSLTLGYRNTFTFADPNGGEITIQARPVNKPLTNIGEIDMVLGRTPYNENNMAWNAISRTSTEVDVRLNVADPCLQPIFNYLTVFDPSTDGVDNDGDLLGDLAEDVPDRSPEWKIPGRININTAPWYVIAQLPWMRYTAVGDDYFRARAIVNNRVANGPYRSTADVMRVPEMASLGSDGFDNLNYGNLPGPDFTEDTASDDLEERDLVFTRISNLVTVRSDVFTAYILVRIGMDGPQKRVIAVLDRSNVYPGPSGGAVGKVKIRALHPVPDPR